MPPPGSGAQPLTIDEKMTFARWIDLGCPIDTAVTDGSPGFGWFLDDLKPTLHVSVPRPGFNPDPVHLLRVGIADANSGIDLATLSLTADFPLEGRPPGAELADLAVEQADGVYAILLSQPLPELTGAMVFAEVADHQGNVTRVARRFSTVEALIFADGFESGGVGAWSGSAGG
jgi:hypothetical protein